VQASVYNVQVDERSPGDSPVAGQPATKLVVVCPYSILSYYFTLFGSKPEIKEQAQHPKQTRTRRKSSTLPV
jgi:hypothetical protein